MNTNTIPVSMIGEVMGVKKSDNANLYVGLAGTMFVGSDRYAVVITEVISPKSVRVADMHDIDYSNNLCKDDNGNDFLTNDTMRNYVKVNPNRTGFVSIGDTYKLRKNGRWIREGRGLWETGAVHFGHADVYMDPSF